MALNVLKKKGKSADTFTDRESQLRQSFDEMRSHSIFDHQLCYQPQEQIRNSKLI